MSGSYHSFSGIIKCFVCRGTDIVTDERTGDVICRECGAVLGEHVHCDGVTWNSYNNDESMYSNKADPNRVGGPVTALMTAESSMNTFIEGGKDKNETRMLKKVQGITMKASGAEMAMEEGYRKIREFAGRLQLSKSTQDNACMLLKQFNDGKVAKKGKVAAGDNICAAVLYVTCKQEPGTVSFRRKDVANVLGITSEQIKKSCNLLSRDLPTSAKGSVRGVDLVPSICSMMDTRAAVTLAAKHAAKRSGELDLVGGMVPKAVAAAAIYLVCSVCGPGGWCENRVFGGDTSRGNEDHEVPEMAMVARFADVGVNSVRRAYAAMDEYRDHLFTKEFLAGVSPKGRRATIVVPASTN